MPTCRQTWYSITRAVKLAVLAKNDCRYSNRKQALYSTDPIRHSSTLWRDQCLYADMFLFNPAYHLNTGVLWAGCPALGTHIVALIFLFCKNLASLKNDRFTIENFDQVLEYVH